jgi:hypothetical protein
VKWPLTAVRRWPPLEVRLYFTFYSIRVSQFLELPQCIGQPSIDDETDDDDVVDDGQPKKRLSTIDCDSSESDVESVPQRKGMDKHL